jgi:hypothetical protein
MPVLFVMVTTDALEKQELGIERQGAREPGALAHAARQLGRIVAARIRRQPDQSELEPGQLVEQALGQG